MNMQETTATLVSNTVFLLSQHPEIWVQLKEDVAQTDITKLTPEMLKSMTLVWNILRESLRLYPVLATAGRTSLQDTVLPRGGGRDGLSPVFVPKNSRIITPYYGLHRDTQVFGDDVEIFCPDRWINIRPKPWEYLPFGNGPRICPGQDKAMLEAGYVIIKFAQKYEKVEGRDDKAWAGRWELTVKNANGCKVAVHT
ncbi:cytochrome P450 [Astrocystis sublimbata]|nr:cytochrome P450 [Astrocystis sublimbata]